MPRRLSAFAVFLVTALVLLVGPASSARPVRAVVPVKSPATFVLPKRPKPMSLAQRAVTIARGQLGVPYRWGGASPGAGFDCSGLVQYVYGRLGITLPHNAASQYGHGRRVARGALRAGDLVFFSGLGHVGIYAGGGKFIHAPQRGTTVRWSQLSSHGSFYGARRLLAA